MASYLGPSTMLLDVALATSADLPDLYIDDQLLLAALRHRGLRAESVIWDDPHIDWSRVGISVVRSTWDYPARRGQFIAWAERVATATDLWNSAAIIRWNTDKRVYLRDLARRGVPVVPTIWLDAFSHEDLSALLASCGWREAVIKPAVSASGQDTICVSPHRLAEGQAHLERLLASGQEVMVQPFFPSISTQGERSLVFIDGRYSHTICKRPARGNFLVHEWFGGSIEAVQPTDDERIAAENVLRALHGPTLYTRIDFLRDAAGQPQLLELEVVEPQLYFRYDAHAADRLAEAITARLDARAARGGLAATEFVESLNAIPQYT